jgi:cytidylate kinase
MDPSDVKPVVTLAALYGAGGSVVGPRVAETLGVQFLDREIPAAVAKKTGLPTSAVVGVDDEPQTVRKRLVSRLGRASTMSAGAEGSADNLDVQDRRLRGYLEEFLASAAASGAVALGRGGMVILRDVPSALHVHLGGPREARIRQAIEIEAINREAAEQRQELEDKSRIDYVRRAYGVDGEDPALYHLVIDSTALDLDACVELIVAASQARVRSSRPVTAPD